MNLLKFRDIMRRIAIVTATRAEYGLLAPIVKKLREYEDDAFRACLVVTGTHLSDSHGKTVVEIEDDGVRIDYKIPVSVESETEKDISLNQADVLSKMADFFEKEHFDAVVLLGDRYETLAVAIAAGNARIPIFHISGGDTTEGAIDEWIRHSITKMSYLHFVTNQDSYRRVIQLGESPDRVFNYGSTSIDNVINLANLSKEEALDSVGLKGCRYALCTYHPVTLEAETVDAQMADFLAAIKIFPELEFIVTKSNADQGGNRINKLLDEAEKRIDNIHVFASLGVRRYLSLMKYAEFVMGNSSSGIVEAPVLHVPTVNIGDRQRGRLQSGSIVNCSTSVSEITKAIEVAKSELHRQICREVVSPYGDGHAAEKIAKKVLEVTTKENIDLKKVFYDLKV